MSETDLGAVVGILALAAAVYTTMAAAAGGWLHRPALVRSAARGVVATGTLITVMVGALLYALWTHDFGVVYVAAYSNLQTSPIYALTALWAGQAGSLMFWSLLLNSCASLVVWQSRGGRYRELLPWVIAVLMAYQVFFLVLVDAIVASPWARLPKAPANGQGLMPLLQNPTMLIHPPALYSGYVAFSVPFAFAIAALITGRVGDEWIRAIRRWTLLAWFFLGCGLLLGASWSYHELGWGGYWAWDPVENVALLPWLTGTALLHSIQIQQRRGMLKVWNMVLVVATFCLTLFGTFMNRSGVESSVHAFEGSALGLPFVLVIAVTVIVSFGLIYRRLPGLGAAYRLTSFFSRETAFLINNLLLAGIAFAVFWGTIFPLVSQATRGAAGHVTVGAPFYNRVTGPLFVLLLLFMAVGPLISWRKASPTALRTALARPLLCAAVVGVGALLVTRNVAASVSIAVCGAVLATIVRELYRGARAKRAASGHAWPLALARLIDGNHGRYGGYIVHAGIALVALGVTGSTLLKADNQAPLRLGQTMRVGAYAITPLTVNQDTIVGVGPRWTARVRVQGPDGTWLLQPRLVVYQDQGNGDQAVGVPAVDSSVLRDVYVTVASVPIGGEIRIHALVNPLLGWIWIGGLVVVLGGLVAFSPSAHERRIAATTPALVPAVA